MGVAPRRFCQYRSLLFTVFGCYIYVLIRARGLVLGYEYYRLDVSVVKSLGMPIRGAEGERGVDGREGGAREGRKREGEHVI